MTKKPKGIDAEAVRRAVKETSTDLALRAELTVSERRAGQAIDESFAHREFRIVPSDPESQEVVVALFDDGDVTVEVGAITVELWGIPTEEAVERLREILSAAIQGGYAERRTRASDGRMRVVAELSGPDGTVVARDRCSLPVSADDQLGGH